MAIGYDHDQLNYIRRAQPDSNQSAFCGWICTKKLGQQWKAIYTIDSYAAGRAFYHDIAQNRLVIFEADQAGAATSWNLYNQWFFVGCATYDSGGVRTWIGGSRIIEDPYSWGAFVSYAVPSTYVGQQMHIGNSSDQIHQYSGGMAHLKVWDGVDITLDDLLLEKWNAEPVLYPENLIAYLPGEVINDPIKDMVGPAWDEVGTVPFEATLSEPPVQHRIYVPRRYITAPPVGADPTISQLTPNWFADGQPNNSVVCTNAGAVQGTGKLEVTDGSTTVEATVGSWTDTLLSDITYNTTGINLGAVSVILTNDLGNSSSPAAATHVATLPSTGLVTSEDLNARMTRPATQALSPTEDPEFTAHVSNTAIGETIIIPSAGVS